MLVDLLGYFRRNSKRMSEFELKRSINEINQIKNELERNLKIKQGVS